MAGLTSFGVNFRCLQVICARISYVVKFTEIKLCRVVRVFVVSDNTTALKCNLSRRSILYQMLMLLLSSHV